ncbi:MAG: cytochrome b [Thiobacillaceae bacterium]|jgi:cytochrome b561|nr:cytochrome b [Thiobacillaceae bacterium]
MSTRPDRYTGIAQALHWLMAVLILAALPLGWVMTEMDLSPLKLRLYSWHKWLGVTVFMLAVLRLAWRATHPAPALPAGMPGWQRAAAGISHALLYLLMLAIPLSGWLMSSAKGFQTVWFGVLPIPDLLGRDEALGEWLNAAHVWLTYALAALLLAHVAAALKHHFVDRDDVLTRMLPGHRKP